MLPINEEECLRFDDYRIRVLAQLWQNRGKPVSGGAISRQLGISRTAVWKHMQALRDRGIPIESHDRKGYVIQPGGRSYLPEWVVLERSQRRIGSVVCYDSVMPSTNDAARRLADQGVAEGCIVFCEQQESGRARGGRTWYSPPNQSIYVSIVLRPALPLHQIPQLTLVAAVAVTKCLRNQFGLDKAEIKWPNDVLIGGQKVCGILVEAIGQPEALEYTVMGIGLNVQGSAEDFPVQYRDRVTTMAAAAGQNFDRLTVLLDLLTEVERSYSEYTRYGFAGIRAQWIQMNGTLGRKVVVRHNNGLLHGRADGLDEDGTLLLRKADGSVERIIAGEIDIVSPQPARRSSQQ